jgi:hypothetical protein
VYVQALRCPGCLAVMAASRDPSDPFVIHHECPCGQWRIGVRVSSGGRILRARRETRSNPTQEQEVT